MTEEELRLAAIHHVVHDYTNLVSAGTLIHQCPPPPLNSHVQYSFIVQCRKFAHFFTNHIPRGGKNDILAEHFVGKDVVFKFEESFDQWRQWDEHMDKHIFHLSYARVDNKRPWTGYGVNKRMLDQFQAAWRKFRKALPEPYKTEFVNQVYLRKQPHANGQPSEFRDLDLD